MSLSILLRSTLFRKRAILPLKPIRVCIWGIPYSLLRWVQARINYHSFIGVFSASAALDRSILYCRLCVTYSTKVKSLARGICLFETNTSYYNLIFLKPAIPKCSSCVLSNSGGASIVHVKSLFAPLKRICSQQLELLPQRLLNLFSLHRIEPSSHDQHSVLHQSVLNLPSSNTPLDTHWIITNGFSDWTTTKSKSVSMRWNMDNTNSRGDNCFRLQPSCTLSPHCIKRFKVRLLTAETQFHTRMLPCS